MNVILFQNRFEPVIASGEKSQTIRPPRKDGRARVKLSETISLRVWTGKPYRSKQREIAKGEVDMVIPVRITRKTIHRIDYNHVLKRHLIAKLDGFAGWRELVDWFESVHGLPFEGQLIHWKLCVSALNPFYQTTTN